MTEELADSAFFVAFFGMALVGGVLWLVNGAKSRPARIRRDHPILWKRGEDLFGRFYRTRTPSDLVHVGLELDSRGFMTALDFAGDPYDDSPFDHVALTHAMNPPASTAPSADLASLDDVELRCYYICLDAYSPAILRRMLSSTTTHLLQPGAADRETFESAVPLLACIKSYLRARHVGNR